MQIKPKKAKEGLGFAVAVALLAALALPLPASIGRKMDHAVDQAKHAVGWDAAGLKTVESDKAGRPTLEAHGNESSKVERKTSYHDNGKKEQETVQVMLKSSGNVAYKSKKNWASDGTLTYSYEEDNSFSADGRQQKGGALEKGYDDKGRQTSEVKKRFSASAQSWDKTLIESADYFDDGDLKTRSVEDVVKGEKTKESWSATKTITGRKKTTEKL